MERLPKRSDARRNRERIIEATVECFAKHGADTSMVEIARRAGLGVGSLYRSFGNRSQLVEAVYRHTADSLIADANQLAAAKTQGQALEAWLHAYIAKYRAKRGMLNDLDAIFAHDPELLRSSRGQARTALHIVLTAAQDVGAARSDINAADLLALAHGIVAGREDDGGRDGILVDLIVQGVKNSDSQC